MPDAEVKMADIIEFPSQTVQGWAGIERTLRNLFDKANAPIEMQEEILIKMKDVFKRYNVKFSVPIELPAILPDELREAVVLSIDRALADYVKQLHDFTSNIIYERLLFEIELYKLRYEK